MSKYYYDEERANNAIGWIECLTHPSGDVAGEPVVLRDWQKKIIRDIFGWIDEETKLRKIREAFIFLARKNSKSFLAACIALYCFFSDPTVGKQIVLAAGDREQAKIVFRDVTGMIRASEWLSADCTVVDSQSRVIHLPTNSVLVAVSADAKLKHGMRPTVVIYDELHIARTSELYNTLRQGMGANKHRLFISITTAGLDDKNSLCRKMYDRAKRALQDPESDPHFLPVIFETDKEDDIWDEKNWHKANPALGDFRLIEEMREYAELARKMPSEENYFRQYYLNQWVQQQRRWIQIHVWDENTKQVDPAILKGKPCWGGLDLSSSNDISSLILLFPQDDDSIDILLWNWLPKDVAHLREKKDGIPYSHWAKQGFIELTQGDYIDQEFIRKRILELDKEYNIQKLCIDQFNASDVLAKLMNDGVSVSSEAYKMYKVSPAAKEFERMYTTKKLNHGGNPVLRWMAGNVECSTNAWGDIFPNKAKSNEKMDGIAASILALIGMLADGRQAEQETEPYYANHDLIIL